MGSEFVLVLVIVAALAFDFTNGFHDTANAMATSIATGALKPRVAVTLSAVLNFAGAFISISVAATIAKGIVNPQVFAGDSGLALVLAALIGAMMWNLITWYFSIPSSSSHALIGGVIGATIVASSAQAVNAHKLVESVLVPACLSPLIAHGDFSAAHFAVPMWVKVACATAIALGTATGGWRIINTMGNRITSIESPQGFAAESASAAVILASSYYGYPLSTTQVVSGGVLGAGLGKRLASVRWGVIGQMATAWTFTIPASAMLAGGAWEISAQFGTSTDVGSFVIAALAALGAFGLYKLAQRNNITPDDLDRTAITPEIEAVRAEAAAAVAA